MCGLTGFFDSTCRRDNDALRETVIGMADTLTHRGPDDSGAWTDAPAGIALGFRRLSIVDLSPAGHQPMLSASGRYVIVFNGEVYNYAAIRREMAGQGTSPNYRGHSDTEVMLAAIEAWGLETAVGKFIGMFAFALWDRHERKLHLVRDRMGVKPMYYGWAGKSFLFGSELKALRCHPEFNGVIDRNALALMMRYGYIAMPHTIYRGFYKLLPGTILTLDCEGDSISEPVPYWSPREVAEARAGDLFTGTDAEAIEHLDGLLRDAIGLRMVADVPLGAFLSGGIDSSLIAALMQAQQTQPVRTFTIGFYDDAYNEARHAEAVARHLGTEHTELYLTGSTVQSIVPRLAALYDEPFADSSQIPTFLVSQLARRHVTVSLSGDGGDELFGGYSRYFWCQNIQRQIGWMSGATRNRLGSAMTAISPTQWEAIMRRLAFLLPEKYHHLNPGDKLAKLAGIVQQGTPEAMFIALLSHWHDPASLVRDSCEPPMVLNDRTQWANLPDFAERMMFLDTVAFLPDDILAKVDRASMGVGLEARVPLLDHRVVEFAWSLPLHLKMREQKGKWLLRQVLYRYVPESMIDRPKMGFCIPIDEWLRGSLRDWAESLLSESRLESEGFLHPEPIRRKWKEHLSGRHNWHQQLWNVLMFQAWLEENR